MRRPLPPQDEQDKKSKSGKSSNPENPASDIKEVWTGNYLFENEWQSFRTKKNPTLEFTSIPYEYQKPGKYKVMVNVVDILGIDTSKIVEVRCERRRNKENLINGHEIKIDLYVI